MGGGEKRGLVRTPSPMSRKANRSKKPQKTVLKCPGKIRKRPPSQKNAYTVSGGVSSLSGTGRKPPSKSKSGGKKGKNKIPRPIRHTLLPSASGNKKRIFPWGGKVQLGGGKVKMAAYSSVLCFFRCEHSWEVNRGFKQKVTVLLQG